MNHHQIFIFWATCRAWGARKWKEIRKKWEMTVKRPLLFYLCIPIFYFYGSYHPLLSSFASLNMVYSYRFFFIFLCCVLRGLPKIFLRIVFFELLYVHSFRFFHVISCCVKLRVSESFFSYTEICCSILLCMFLKTP